MIDENDINWPEKFSFRHVRELNEKGSTFSASEVSEELGQFGKKLPGIGMILGAAIAAVSVTGLHLASSWRKRYADQKSRSSINEVIRC